MPNVMMLRDIRARRIDPAVIPTVNDAVASYRAQGGHLTDPDELGVDPISHDREKSRIHQQSFSEKFPSFGLIVNLYFFGKGYCFT